MTSMFCAVAASAALASSALAGRVYSFAAITQNGAQSAGEGVAQLSMTVSAVSRGIVSFRFANSGPAPFSISEIYWDNRSRLLDEVDSIVNGPGVRFRRGADPRRLPGGAAAGFESSFGVEARAPGRQNGVNAGEWVDVRIELEERDSFSAVIAALDSSALRVGIRAVGFGGGRSESFVSAAPLAFNAVPLPSAAGLGFASLGVLAARRRRR